MQCFYVLGKPVFILHVYTFTALQCHWLSAMRSVHAAMNHCDATPSERKPVPGDDGTQGLSQLLGIFGGISV